MTETTEKPTMDLMESVNQVQPLEVFKPNFIDDLIKQVRIAADKHVGDVSTDKGRKAIISNAFKVTKTKTTVEKIADKLVEGDKNKIKDIRANIKVIEDEKKRFAQELDAIAAKKRKPVSDWEEAEKGRKAKEKAEAEFNQAWDEAHAEHELFLRQKEIEAKEAQLKKEAEERAKAEALEKQKKEVAEAARREAEEKARNIVLEAERKAIEERMAREKAEQEAKDAAVRAEIEKEEAVKKAKEDAEREAREKKEAEEKEAARVAAEEKAKSEDEAHRSKINYLVLKTLVAHGIDGDIAKAVVDLASSGRTGHMIINY
jgi:hypothetical protein